MQNPAISFSPDGDRLTLTDPLCLRSADADLWNEKLYLQIDHRGKVIRSGWLTPDLTQYSQPLRTFYLRDNDSGQLWSAPQAFIRKRPDEFSFSAGKSDITWSVTLHDIKCTIRVIIPVEDPVELWTVTLHNLGHAPRSLSVFSYFPVGKLSWFRHDGRYEPELKGIVFQHFPYYVDYRDYYKLRNGHHCVYLVSDRDPDGWMWNTEDFIGHGTLENPDALRQAALPAADRCADADTDSAAILQFDHRLAPGISRSINFAFGPARTPEAAAEVAGRHLTPGAIDKALKKSLALYKEHPPALRIKTPDADFDAYINHWLPRRALMLVRAMRFMSAPQGRNLLQDAMGGSLVDPAASRRWFLKFYSFQNQDGWLPHGMPLEPGATQIRINTIPHKDINSWGPAAITYYLNEVGDHSILDAPIPFADAPEFSAPLYDHVCKGLDWLLKDRTARGLSRIGQGDWNDPLNMAGHGELGESIWLSEALSLALDTWAPVCERRDDGHRASVYRTEAAALRDAINALAWDGEWYARGFTDAGRAFGSHRDTEGRIFLNAQSWAIMCGAATDARARSCIAAVEKLLDTPSGPMMLAPAYTDMREDIGKLSQKAPGRLENGSVYCHAATFYAYALYQVREGDRGYDVLRRLLTGARSNPPERSLQLPLYIPNAYNGLAAGARSGVSTRSANTGTAAWYYRTVIDGLFGLKAHADFLEIDPQIPSAWPSAEATRLWRGASFDIQIRREHGLSNRQTILNGTPCPCHQIPVQKPGTRHNVVALLPAS